MFAHATTVSGGAAVATADPWAFEPHPEVWLLIAAVIGMAVYVVKVIGPNAVPEGEPIIGRRQVAWFVAGTLTLWLASDWPMHDIAERSLYSVHMVQHMLLTYLVPPMFWLAMPTWLARLLVPAEGRGYRLLRRLGAPLAAGLIFNALVVVTHWSVIVNTSVRVGAVHYSVHLIIVASAFLMWLPVCGPWPELRISPVAQCIYLFMMSVIPTVPGAWLSLSESPVYEVYDHEPRLWGLSVIEDQTMAGLFMKVIGGSFLWAVIVGIFFRWGLQQEREARHPRAVDPVAADPADVPAEVV